MSRAQLTSTVEQNTGGAVAPFVAGKNKIINGDFGVWQRGTSFTTTAGTSTYYADRYQSYWNGGVSVVISQQNFTPGTAPVAGYESSYFYRWAQATNGSGMTYCSIAYQPIENVRTFAGQTVTISFWAKADAARQLDVGVFPTYGTGGSAAVYNYATLGMNITTNWTRYSITYNVPSVAGKTIGAGSYLAISIEPTAKNTAQTIDLWGVQVEAGSVATPFTTATGTLSGELMACQRYYWRLNGSDVSGSTIANICNGYVESSTVITGIYNFPIQMRIPPSIAGGASTNFIALGGGSFHYPATLSTQAISKINARISLTQTSLTAYQAGALLMSYNATDYLEHSAEL